MSAPSKYFWNRLTATIIFLIFVWGLWGHPVDGIPSSPEPLVEKYTSGKVHFTIEIDKHRQPHGWSRENTEAENLKTERHYKHGVRDGISRLYYTSGELMTEWVYRKGKRHGRSLGYFKDGRIKDQGNYQNDRLEGEVLKYYPGGTLKARMSFKHDRLDGESIIYFENGQAKYIYRYFKGRAWTREDYSPDGKLLSKQEFPQPSHLP